MFKSSTRQLRGDIIQRPAVRTSNKRDTHIWDFLCPSWANSPVSAIKQTACALHSFRRRWVIGRLERTNNCVVRWFNKLQVPAFTTLLIFYFTELFLISDYWDTLLLYARLTVASEESLDFTRNFVRKMKYKNDHPLWWAPGPWNVHLSFCFIFECFIKTLHTKYVIVCLWAWKWSLDALPFGTSLFSRWTGKIHQQRNTSNNFIFRPQFF